MQRRITAGPLAGNAVRIARKRHACAGWTLPKGHRHIEPGEAYAEGDPDPDSAGGFGRHRLCADCVPEIREI